MGRWLDRGATYLPMIRRRLAEARLPEELCWLPMIESGFSNTAVSPKGAAGMWQLMPATARAYGLRVDGLVDERRNPQKATRAALLHLRDLMDQFRSPFLAAAAYNTGSSRVERGLTRLEERRPEFLSAVHSSADSIRLSRRTDDFFRLSAASLLARETREYVPRLIAASMIGREPARYGFHLRPAPSMRTDSVVVAKAIDLDLIARTAGVPASLVRELNPELIHGVTPPGSRTIVRLPRGFDHALRDQIAALPEAEVDPKLLRVDPEVPRAARSWLRSRWAAWPPPEPRQLSARSGETLIDVARRCGVSAATLSRINHLPQARPLLAGQVVRLP
jgi:membrane-bound lytic murein transglycosylase D